MVFTSFSRRGHLQSSVVVCKLVSTHAFFCFLVDNDQDQFDWCLCVCVCVRVSK